MSALVDEAAGFIGGLRPDGLPPQAITVSFRSAPGILAFVNDVFARSGERAATARAGRVQIRRQRSIPGRDAGKPDKSRTRDEPRSGATSAGAIAAAEAVGDEIVRLLGHGDGARSGDRVRREARPADVAILFDRATATASSKRRSIAAACRPTSTRGSVSSTPTRSRTRSRCCATSRIRRRTCARPPCSARASSACRTRRSRGSRGDLAEAILGVDL